MILVFGTSSATSDPLLDGTTWLWTWSAGAGVTDAPDIVCLLEPETLRLPGVAPETLCIQGHAPETLGIRSLPAETIRC